MKWTKPILETAATNSEKKRKQFIFSGLFLLLAAFFWAFSTFPLFISLVVGTIGLVGIAVPTVMQKPLWAWLVFGGFLGELVSTIVLFLLYFLLAWPLKLFIKTHRKTGWKTIHQEENISENPF